MLWADDKDLKQEEIDEDEEESSMSLTTSRADEKIVEEGREMMVYQHNQAFNDELEVISRNNKKAESEPISDIDNDEIQQFILNPDEKKLKKVMWYHMNKEWIKEQKEKKMADERMSNNKRPRKRKTEEDKKKKALGQTISYESMIFK